VLIGSPWRVTTVVPGQLGVEAAHLEAGVLADPGAPPGELKDTRAAGDVLVMS
jgi:hypothetical protein